MPYLNEQSARTFEVHGVRFTSFAGTPVGATSLAAWRADFAPETSGQTHSMSTEEILLVTSGELHVELGAEVRTLSTGEAALVPAGTSLRVSSGAQPASAWVTTPVGMTATMTTGEELVPPWAQ